MRKKKRKEMMCEASIVQKLYFIDSNRDDVVFANIRAGINSIKHF